MGALPRVLVLSVDTTMGGLLTLNLERRAFDARPYAWAACCGIGEVPRPYPADLLIADLHCPAPECWNAGPNLRALFPRMPLLLLAHDRPSPRYLHAHHPCQSLQKPFGVADALDAVYALIQSGLNGTART